MRKMILISAAAIPASLAARTRAQSALVAINQLMERLFPGSHSPFRTTSRWMVGKYRIEFGGPLLPGGTCTFHFSDVKRKGDKDDARFRPQ